MTGAAPDNYKQVYTDLEQMSVGFLTGTLNSIEVAHFGVFATGLDMLNYVAEVTAGSVLPAGANAAVGAIGFEVQVDQLDGTALQTVDLSVANPLDLIRYNIAADLPTALVGSAFAFDITLTQSSSFNTAAGPDTAKTGVPLNVVRFGLDHSNGVFENGVAVGTMTFKFVENLAESLHKTTAQTIAEFLAGVSGGVTGFLESNDFSLGVPLTDIDVADAFEGIASTFKEIPALFAVEPADLGFTQPDPDNAGSEIEFSFFSLAQPALPFIGEDLSDSDLQTLAGMKTLDLNVYAGFANSDDAGASQTTGAPTPVSIDLSGLDPFDVYGNVRSDFLTDFAAALNASLGSHGWLVTAASARSLSFGANVPVPKLFVISSATDRNDNPATVTLGEFGVVKAQTGVITDDDGNTFDYIEADAGETSIELRALNENLLKGMRTVTFDVSIDGVKTQVEIQQPTAGWGDISGTPSPLEGLIDGINDAFDTKGIEVQASKNAAGDGLKFDLDGNAEARYQIGLNADKLTRAQDLKGLMAWMTNELAELPCFPDFEFDVDIETGEFLLSFANPMEKSVSADGGMDLADLELAELEGLNLKAQLAGSIVAQLDMSAGFNIFDIQDQYAADGIIKDAVLDNSYFSDLNLNAVLDVQATGLVASAEIGMIELGIGLGGASANENFARINTEFDLTIVGQDNGDFSERLTASQMLSIAAGAELLGYVDPSNTTGTLLSTPVYDTDGTLLSEAVYTTVPAGSQLIDLVGRADVTGGIAIDENGCAVDATGRKITDFSAHAPAATPADLLTIANGADRVDGQDYAMAFFNFEAPSLNFGGLAIDPNLLNRIDTTIHASVVNLFDPVASSKLCYDFDEALCLTLLDPNTILDALSGFGQLLEAYTDNLNDNFPVLNEDIPLLNESILSNFDFVSEFNDAMEQLRDDGDFSYATIESLLESVFGDDTVAITFNTANGACELLFDLQLEYLDDYTETLPFNFGLESLLGADGLSTMLGDTGAEALEGVLTNLVDARADAELVLDPLLGLNLSLGIDLTALKTLTTDLANGTTDISNLGTVTAIATTGLGQDDLRIDWRDITDNQSKSFFFDLDQIFKDANASGDIVDIDHIVAAFNAELTNGLSVEFDATTGILKLLDPNATAVDLAGVTALFGGVQAEAAADAVVLGPTDTYTPREIAFEAGFDTAAAYKFALTIGEQVTEINIAEEAARDADGFADAFNEALLNAFVDRGEISETALIGSKIAISQLLRVVVYGANVKIETTNFAQHNGYDEFAFAIGGNDISREIELEISEFGQSNLARALGFNSGETYDGDAVGSELRVKALGLDKTGVTALFGGKQFEDEADQFPAGSTYVPREIDLLGSIDFAQSYSFDLVIGNAAPKTVEIAADPGRDQAGFVAQFNTELADISVNRSAIDDAPAPGAPAVDASDLLQLIVDATSGDLKLATTGYAHANALAEFKFGVQGNQDAGVTFTKPVVFIDTEKTGISANLSLGTPEGLNMVVALGPLEASIENGTAFIGGSGGDGRGYIKGVVQDVDGEDDGRYDLLNLYDISQEEEPDYLKLFGLDVDFETRINLPFSGAFGLLNPDEHGFVYESTLLRTIGDPADPNNNAVSADQLKNAIDALTNPTDQEVLDTVLTFFEGDAKSLIQTGSVPTDITTRPPEVADGDPLPADYYDASGGLPYGPHFYELKLPGSGLFDCAGILDLVNDPLALVNGLDSVMSTIQGFVDDYLADINLPIVGDSLALGAGFFDDFRYDVLDEARTELEKPKADGSLPTTLDLINVILNDSLNELIGTANQTLIAATIADEDDAFIYGALSFQRTIFSEDLDIGFALDIPGLNLDVDSGSAINLSAILDITMGFGLDCNGFFVLNDTDAPEAALTLTADASTFVGEMNIGGVLDVTASAVQQSGDANGPTHVTATMGFDLYGDSGAENDGSGAIDARAYTFDETDVAALNVAADRTFEKTVYISQIDFSNFAEFVFRADIAAHLDLAVAFSGGAGSVVPKLYTDFILNAEYDPLVNAKDINITALEFKDISLDTQTLEDIIRPVLDPIMDTLSPIKDVIDALDIVPVSIAIDAFKTAFPILNVFDQIDNIYTILESVDSSSDGTLKIGTYDFLGVRDSILLSKFDTKHAVFKPTFAVDVNVFASATASGPGIIFDFPLLTDPFQALNLMLGKFDQVDIVTTTFRLLEAEINLNVATQILNDAGLPGWASSAIRNAFSASLDVYLKAGLKVGYDLTGVVNFANTYDTERLLDGVFIDSAPGSLVSGHIGGHISLNAGIAGASGGINGNVSLSLNDPNQDGKLRIPELLTLVELADAQSGLEDTLGALFNGSIDFSAYLRIWAGINLPWPLPDLKWSTTVFDQRLFGYSLPVILPEAEIATITNSTAILNAGARAGANLSSVDTDGNDVINVSNNGATFSASGKQFSGDTTFDGAVNGIIIPAGEGNNRVDLSAITNCTATITYAGKGSDTIVLPACGTHVVFAGKGTDTITVAPNASGTYYIFAEGGADTVNITTSGKAVIFADDDFEMREHFLRTFNNGGLTEAAINAAINTQSNFQMSGQAKNLAQVQASYTAGSQITSSRSIETITVGGNGDHVILTGKGDDLITVGAGSGRADIFAGAGDDEIRITGKATSFVEGGSGEDLIVFENGGTNTAYGWGLAGETGNFNHLMRADGDDIIIGSTGTDTFFGQFGKDILGGGNGDDMLNGGRDNDFVSGGILKVSVASSGNIVDLTASGALDNLQTRLIVETEIGNDGVDTIHGDAGNDVLFGGGGNDVMHGDEGADILVGDYGKISVSANRTAETFVSTGMTELSGGRDELFGGAGGDILVAGGSVNAKDTEVIKDLIGDNIVFGDFGITEGARILENVTAYRAIASDQGTIDNITTGIGNDVIVGGERGDIINSGLGGDFIISDLGSFVPAKGLLNNDIYDTATGTTQTNNSTNEGNDIVTLGTMSAADITEVGGKVPDSDMIDIVLGGGGNDQVTSQEGGVIFLGDYGRMNLNPSSVSALFDLLPLPDGIAATDPRKIAYDEQIELIARIFSNMTTVTDANVAIGDARSGDDRITTVGGTVYTILGGGADTVNLGDGLSYVLTDDGRLGITPTETTGTPPEKYSIIKGESVSTALAGNDTVNTTGTLRDIILTGDGADVIDAGEGLNFVLTDNGTLETTDSPNLHPTKFKSVEGAGDGIDRYTGGANEDFVVLGGRSDIADLEEGVNYVLADSGEIEHRLYATGASHARLSSNTSVPGHFDGDDKITTGDDDDFIILGLGGDEATTGEGRNHAIAGAGSITFDRNAAGDTTLAMASQAVNPLAVDGDDDVTMGSGDSFVILGLGSDEVTVGDGTNHIHGGVGTLNFARSIGGDTTMSMASLAVNPLATDGSETVTTGEGNDYVILGLGEDVANVSEGRNRVVGDEGTMSYVSATGAESVGSRDGAYGDVDTVTSGSGADILVMGNGADVARSNAGADIIVGDNALVQKNGTNGLHNLTVYTTGGGGDDMLFGGADNDIIIGALGADQIETGTGEDFVLGDLGDLTFRNDTDVQSLTYTVTDQGGDDVITATGAGDNILIGQFGADTITGGDDDDWLVGDLAELALSDIRNVFPGQSAFDRLTLISFTGVSTIFDDLLMGGSGNDFLMGGFGADRLYGGAGQDFLFGDTGQVTRSVDPSSRYESFWAETNDAFIPGGYDILDGGTGPDILIGGLGPDLFFGDTASKLLIGDVFAGLFRTVSPFDFTQATPDRKLYVVNFAGFTPTDLLSASQIGDAIGVKLGSEPSETSAGQSETPGLTGSHSDAIIAMDLIESFFSDTDVLHQISNLVYFGIDSELILEDILRFFKNFMLSSPNSNAVVEYRLLELRLQKLIDQAKARSEADAAPPESQSDERLPRQSNSNTVTQRSAA